MTGTRDLAFWQAAARSSPDGLIIADHAGTIHFASDRIQSLLGWTPEELVGMPVEALIPEAKRDAYRARPSSRLTGIGRELFALTKDGKLHELEIALSPMPFPDGFFVLASLRAPSPQRRLEKAFQSIFKATASSFGADFISELVSALGATAGVDCALLAVPAPGADDRLMTLAFWQSGRLIEHVDYPIVNTPCERVFKGEEVIVLERAQELFPRDQDLVRIGVHAYIGVPLRASSGRVLGNLVLLHGSALPDGADLLPALKLFAMRAASELERLDMEARLARSMKVSFQSEKLAAVGQLAAGIAHEINNPLGVILGFAQALPKRIKEGDPLAPPLRSIEREALRCKGLVANLLAFSRRDPDRFRNFELNEVLESALLLVEAQARVCSVAIRREGDGSGRRIHGDFNQIQQVIITLCSNAIDAMSGGGTLTVGDGSPGDKPGFAEIRIADTGPGIPADIRSKIFEPFFTTKEVGKGTGLGLALVSEIASRHGGGVEYDTVLGKGTVFRVTLPLAS
jgi:PAS domain S-box-containing protein